MSRRTETLLALAALLLIGGGAGYWIHPGAGMALVGVATWFELTRGRER